jgi:hypothetical protein
MVVLQMAGTPSLLFKEEERRLLLICAGLHTREQAAIVNLLHPGRMVLYAEQVRLEASLKAIRLQYHEANLALRSHRTNPEG